MELIKGSRDAQDLAEKFRQSIRHSGGSLSMSLVIHLNHAIALSLFCAPHGTFDESVTSLEIFVPAPEIVHVFVFPPKTIHVSGITQEIIYFTVVQLMLLVALSTFYRSVRSSLFVSHVP